MRAKRLNKLINKNTILDVTNIYGPYLNDSLTFNLPPTRNITLNTKLFAQINQMKYTAAHYRMLYITANQVEGLDRVFLINQKYQLGSITHKEYDNPLDYKVFINPKIIQAKGQPEQVEQLCLVIPFIKFYVPRFNQIRLKYRDQSPYSKQQNFSGKRAHLIQHCINHLDGELILDYKLSHGRFTVQEDILQFFPKTSFLLKEYSLRLKMYEGKIQRKQIDQKDEKYKLMKQDYIFRLKNEYQKQHKKFSQLIDKKKYNFN